MRLGVEVFDFLTGKEDADAVSCLAESWEEAVIISLAATEACAGGVEGYAGDEDEFGFGEGYGLALCGVGFHDAALGGAESVEVGDSPEGDFFEVICAGGHDEGEASVEDGLPVGAEIGFLLEQGVKACDGLESAEDGETVNVFNEAT